MAVDVNLAATDASWEERSVFVSDAFFHSRKATVSGVSERARVMGRGERAIAYEPKLYQPPHITSAYII
jgi:hypothetical protein